MSSVPVNDKTMAAEYRWRREQEEKRMKMERAYQMAQAQQMMNDRASYQQLGTATSANSTTWTLGSGQAFQARCTSCEDHKNNRAKRDENGGLFCKSCDSTRLNGDGTDFLHNDGCPWKAVCDELAIWKRLAEERREAEIKLASAEFKLKNALEMVEALTAEVKALRGESMTIKRARITA